jgi:hypothetical protein
MIINIGKLSIWCGNIPLKKSTIVPRLSYLNGGSYWKLSMLWFKFYLELSGLKTDNKLYKEVSKQELDKILKNLK